MLECFAIVLLTLICIGKRFLLSNYFLYITQAATKILARQLIRLRQQIEKLQGSRAQMRGVATHTQV